jgi:putative phosphoesterase
MRIAVISDTHSRYADIEAALKLIEARRAELILHCGDIEDAEAVWLFPGHTHFVFGNCDHERAAIRQAVHGIGGTLHEPFGRLEVGGVRLAWLHGDDAQLFRQVEQQGGFDYLFHGHTHAAGERQAGATRVINPGAFQRVRVKTFLVLDTESGETESVVVEGG